MKLTYRKYTQSLAQLKVGRKVGRKRLEKTKKTIGLSVDAKLVEELKADGVNMSRLFSIFARKYLRNKSKIGK